MKKVLCLLFLLCSSFSFTAATLALHQPRPRNELQAGTTSVIAVMTSSKTDVTVDENVSVAMTIVNAWYWKVHNVSFSLLLPLPQDFDMLDQTFTGEGQASSTIVGEGNVNVSVRITSGVQRNSTTTFYLTGAFRDTGDFAIDVSPITIVKSRGAITVQDQISCAGPTFSVEGEEERPPFPIQGDRQIEEIMFIVLVAVPIALLVVLAAIEKKPY